MCSHGILTDMLIMVENARLLDGVPGRCRVDLRAEPPRLADRAAVKAPLSLVKPGKSSLNQNKIFFSRHRFCASSSLYDQNRTKQNEKGRGVEILTLRINDCNNQNGTTVQFSPTSPTLFLFKSYRRSRTVNSSQVTPCNAM